MLTKHIETVKAQIKFFDYRINKSRKDTRAQATYWPLKYKFEQLLEYLEKQSKCDQSHLKEQVVKDSHRIVNKRKGTRENTIEFEKIILGIMNNYPDGIHVKDVHQTILETNPSIPYSKIANRISEMYAKKGMLDWVSKGVYRIKRN